MNRIRKISYLCALLLLLTGAIPTSAAESTATSPPAATQEKKQHSGKTWDEIKNIRYDFDTVSGHITRMEELAEEATLTAQADHEEEVLELYQQFMEDAELLKTSYSIIHISYYCDVQNESLAQQEEEMHLELVDLLDRMCIAMDVILKSPYREILNTVMTQEQQEEFLDYEKLTDREKELIEEQSGLTQEYDRLSAQEYSVTIDGKEWTYENLATDAEDIDTMIQVYRELERVQNEALSDIYLDLIAINVEIAAMEEYDNYLDYAMEEVYERDYSAADVESLFEEIKEYAVPLYIEMRTFYYMLDWDAVSTIDTDEETILNTLEPFMHEIDEDIYDTFLYMREHGLYDIGESSKKGEGAFTTDLPYLGEAFIYSKPAGNYNDYSTLVHEFGHFYNEFISQGSILYDNSSLDLKEIHSTGLQMLFREYSADMFGEETGRSYDLLQLLNILQSGIIYQAMISEFEIEVYRNPDMSVQDMNRLYARLEREYATGFGFGLDDTEYEESYGWVGIMHLYHSPLYCISYVTSSLSSFDLFFRARNDREAAIASYMELTALPADTGYTEALELCDFHNIFEEGAVETILMASRIPEEPADGEAGNTERIKDYGITESDIPSARAIWEENKILFIYLIGTAAVYSTVLSLAGIVTGIIVLCRRQSARNKQNNKKIL